MTKRDLSELGNVPGAPIYPCLRGKAVVVSGGATGIGAAIVAAFAVQGAHVGFVDIDHDAGRGIAFGI